MHNFFFLSDRPYILRVVYVQESASFNIPFLNWEHIQRVVVTASNNRWNGDYQPSHAPT